MQAALTQKHRFAFCSVTSAHTCSPSHTAHTLLMTSSSHHLTSYTRLSWHLGLLVVYSFTGSVEQWSKLLFGGAGLLAITTFVHNTVKTSAEAMIFHGRTNVTISSHNTSTYLIETCGAGADFTSQVAKNRRVALNSVRAVVYKLEYRST